MSANRIKKDKKGIVVNCEKLRIREKPDTSSNTIGLLSQYEEVEIEKDINDDFYKLAGKSGYVMKAFIRLKQLS